MCGFSQLQQQHFSHVRSVFSNLSYGQRYSSTLTELFNCANISLFEGINAPGGFACNQTADRVCAPCIAPQNNTGISLLCSGLP